MAEKKQILLRMDLDEHAWLKARSKRDRRTMTNTLIILIRRARLAEARDDALRAQTLALTALPIEDGVQEETPHGTP